METIKNYLETMFANLPNTLEVKKAKDELYSMMEDKFTELIGEGKPENEAIAIVISEFGNLDEISESLGINNVVSEMETTDRRLISQNECDNYIADSARRRFFNSLGILLCIFSPIGPIIFGSIGDAVGIDAIELIGVILLFICVAAGISLFMIASFLMRDWKFLDKELCTISYSTAEYLAREKEDSQSYKLVLRTLGIVLCSISFLPVIILDTILGSSFSIITEGFAPALIFIGAGIGVFFIMFSGAKDAAFDKLLSLNDTTTVAGNYEPVKKVKKEYVSRAAEILMKDYWKTVLAIYLILSFTSFNWGSTWLIWPIAGILRKPLTEIFLKK